MIAFGGLAGRMEPVPLFEFFNLISSFGVKKAFVRDLEQSWYHRGVAGIGPNIDAVAQHLRELVAGSGAKRTVLIGNSAGAYAALLFGKLLDVDEVHAFGAQTFIDPALLERHADNRWDPHLERLHRSGSFDSRYSDLRPILERDGTRTTFHLYYAAKTVDAAHSLHIGDVDGVVLHPFELELELGGHGIVKLLRDSGELMEILERALGAG